MTAQDKVGRAIDTPEVKDARAIVNRWHRHLLCFLGVNISLILQLLNLGGRCRIRYEARFASFPCQVRLEQLISMPDALYCFPERKQYSARENVFGGGRMTAQLEHDGQKWRSDCHLQVVK